MGRKQPCYYRLSMPRWHRARADGASLERIRLFTLLVPALNSVTGCNPLLHTCNAWPQQYLEPVYLWMNTLPAGMSGETNIQDSVTVNNRDYYFDCGSYNSSCSSGFTGAHGTGYGTLANRPSTCTAGPGGTYGASPTGSYGVAYFATDANNGQGELYVCTATNTWTPVYEPYIYPHPLESGVTQSTNTVQPPTTSVRLFSDE